MRCNAHSNASTKATQDSTSQCYTFEACLVESEIPTLQPKYALDNNTLMISICPTSPHVLSILLPFQVRKIPEHFDLVFRGALNRIRLPSINCMGKLSCGPRISLSKQLAWLRVMYLAERSKTRFLRDH